MVFSLWSHRYKDWKTRYLNFAMDTQYNSFKFLSQNKILFLNNSRSRSSPRSPLHPLRKRTSPNPKIFPRLIIPRIHSPITNPLVWSNRNPLHHLSNILLIPFPHGRSHSRTPLVKCNRIKDSFAPSPFCEDLCKICKCQLWTDDRVCL